MQTTDARLNKGEMDGECLLVSDATPAVPPLPLRSNTPVFLFFWHVTVDSLHNDEAALLLSPRIITCDKKTDAQFCGVFLLLNSGGIYSFFFFFFLSQRHTFSARICLWLLLSPPPFTTCIHRTDPHRAFQTNLMGFLQRGEKLRGFLQFVWCWWKLVSYGSVFKPLSVNGGFR